MEVKFVLGSICGLMQAVIVFVCGFDPWWFSCMVPQGVEVGRGLFAGTTCSIVNDSIPLICMVVLERAWGHQSTTYFLLLPLTLLYCLCILIRLSLSCPQWHPRSLPWVVATNTGCSCQCMDSSDCVFYCGTFHLSTGSLPAIVLCMHPAWSGTLEESSCSTVYTRCVLLHLKFFFTILLIFTDH